MLLWGGQQSSEEAFLVGGCPVHSPIFHLLDTGIPPSTMTTMVVRRYQVFLGGIARCLKTTALEHKARIKDKENPSISMYLRCKGVTKVGKHSEFVQSYLLMFPPAVLARSWDEMILM